MSKVPNVLLLLGCSVRDGNSGKTILSTTEHVKAYIEKKIFLIITAYRTGQSKTELTSGFPGDQPRLIQGIRRRDGIGDLFIYKYLSKI